MKKQKALTKKEQESLRLKEKICDVLAEKEHEFYRNYTKTVYGTAIVYAKNMKEAQKMFDKKDYDMDDNDEDIDWDEIEEG